MLSAQTLFDILAILELSLFTWNLWWLKEIRRWFWKSGETMERRMQGRSAFRIGETARSNFQVFRSTAFPPWRWRVVQWGSISALDLPCWAVVSQTEVRLKNGGRWFCFSGSRRWRVAWLFYIGVVNRWRESSGSTRWGLTSQHRRRLCVYVRW